MNNLILFTSRSGSTLFADILAYNDGSINLGEGLHSIARNYNYNKAGNEDTTLYKKFSKDNLTANHHNVRTRGSDHIGFFIAKQQRIDLLKNTKEQWTIKENTEKQLMGFNFVKHCCDSPDINVYMTHRANVVDQFVSFINARYRAEIAKHTSSHFIFTNNDSYQQYSEMCIPFNWLHMYVNVFIEQLLMWRTTYDRFKPYVKIVSYENNVRPMNFESIGISKQVVDNYKRETNHLVPTPNNVRNVVVVDDHPKPMRGAWEQSLFYINHHKHLVEI